MGGYLSKNPLCMVMECYLVPVCCVDLLQKQWNMNSHWLFMIAFDWTHLAPLSFPCVPSLNIFPILHLWLYRTTLLKTYSSFPSLCQSVPQLLSVIHKPLGLSVNNTKLSREKKEEETRVVQNIQGSDDHLASSVSGKSKVVETETYSTVSLKMSAMLM